MAARHRSPRRGGPQLRSQQRQPGSTPASSLSEPQHSGRCPPSARHWQQPCQAGARRRTACPLPAWHRRSAPTCMPRARLRCGSGSQMLCLRAQHHQGQRQWPATAMPLGWRNRAHQQPQIQHSAGRRKPCSWGVQVSACRSQCQAALLHQSSVRQCQWVPCRCPR